MDLKVKDFYNKNYKYFDITRVRIWPLVIKLAKSIRDEYNIKNLCMAGGVALNCVANGKILEKKIFDKIWIQPAAGDAGGSLGAALAYWYLELKKERRVSKIDNMKGSFLGPSYSDKEIEKRVSKEVEIKEDAIQREHNQKIEHISSQHQQEIKFLEGEIENLKTFKLKQSTKYIGESFENYLLIVFRLI